MADFSGGGAVDELQQVRRRAVSNCHAARPTCCTAIARALRAALTSGRAASRAGAARRAELSGLADGGRGRRRHGASSRFWGTAGEAGRARRRAGGGLGCSVRLGLIGEAVGGMWGGRRLGRRWRLVCARHETAERGARRVSRGE
eukprot:1568646-Prymnesium_polylepis.1